MKIPRSQERLNLEGQIPDITEAQMRSARIHAAHYVTDIKELREVLQMFGEVEGEMNQ